MMGLEKEILFFFYAMLTGISAKSMYDILDLFRKIIRHAGWVIGLEDLCYWIAMAIFLFAALFCTTNGSVRWFWILGLACGILTEYLLKKWTKKVLDKIKKKI